MVTINTLKKYNLEDNSFSKDFLSIEKGLSFSIARKRSIANEEDNQFEYIIFCNGNRAKDISKDLIHPYGQRNYVERISNYFKKQKKNVIIEHILLDNDAPLNLEVKMIANHINQLSLKEDVRSIHMIGHSKGADIFFNIPKYFKMKETQKKTSMYLTAAPYEGCSIATKTIFLEEAKQIIMTHLPHPLSEYTYIALKKYYNAMHSNTHMDNDIAKIGYEAEYYDPSFIRDMFSIDNLKAIQKLNYFINFVTGIDEKTLMNSIKQNDLISIGMCLIDKYFIKETSDGFVEQKSQLSINNHIEVNSRIIPSTTHYFLSHDDKLEIVLNYVYNQMEKIKDKETFYQKRKYIKL